MAIKTKDDRVKLIYHNDHLVGFVMGNGTTKWYKAEECPFSEIEDLIIEKNAFNTPLPRLENSDGSIPVIIKTGENTAVRGKVLDLGKKTGV